jgi:hypothetical protein
MLTDKFIKITFKVWRDYLQRVKSNLGEKIILPADVTLLYPNILIYTPTNDSFVVELIGANPSFDTLLLKSHKETSINRYLNQFSDEPADGLFHLDSSGPTFTNLCLAQEADLEELKLRFPAIDLFPSRLVRSGGKGAVFSFGHNFEYVTLNNCIIVNKASSAFRTKHVMYMLIIRRNITENRYKEILKQIFENNTLKGVHLCPRGKEKDYILAGQLQNLYLFPNLHETIIGEFLKSHPEIIHKSLLTKNFIYEPYLLWIEGPEDNKDKAINPDLFVERNDGFYDIYDLKTAALTKQKITKGLRRRRRFIDYVQEGIAQLANYKEYFSYQKNRDYAKEKYGIEISDPNLTLIVGNYENANLKEIQEACRQLDNINIMDYDSLVQLFLAGCSSG